jgi:hypothetical protein
MARPEGFEPPTLCLEGRCSIRLSYGRSDYHFHFKPFLDLVSSDLSLTVPELCQNLASASLRKTDDGTLLFPCHEFLAKDQVFEEETILGTEEPMKYAY